MKVIQITQVGRKRTAQPIVLDHDATEMPKRAKSIGDLTREFVVSHLKLRQLVKERHFEGDRATDTVSNDLELSHLFKAPDRVWDSPRQPFVRKIETDDVSARITPDTRKGTVVITTGRIFEPVVLLE